jgi:cytochrome c peroxidase
LSVLVKQNGPELMRAFRVPTLRNIAKTAPYMHAGQYPTLRQVMERYSKAPQAPNGRSEIEPLNLSVAQMDQLEAFLKTLNE